jgi:SAM-dependent methyltransferase
MDELPHEPSFDFIWCFQVLIHLTEPLTLEALKAIRTFLKPDGVAYASAAINDDAPTFRSYGAWRDYVLNEGPARWYVERAAEAGLAMEELGALSATGIGTRGAGKGLRMFRIRHAAS